MTNVVERFSDRFCGLQRAYGTYVVAANAVPDDRGKITGKAVTLRGDLTTQQWRDHLNGDKGLGITPINDDSVCRFGAIDVDVYPLNLENLEKRVVDMELPLVVCRTKSGGAHLYLFLSEPAKASLIRNKLMEWSILIGHPDVEVFPKQSALGSEEDIGCWINIPYFSARRSMRYAIADGKSLTIEEFLDHADEKAVTAKELKTITGRVDTELENAPPCLQHLALEGFPEGTRNIALYNLGILCKMKFGDTWQDKLAEFNTKYLSPPLPLSEVNLLIKQLAKKDYFYKCKEPPLAQACNKSVCIKRKFGLDNSSNDPGIILDGLVKILTDPPMWLVNVNEKRVALDDSLDLLQQNKFERICLDAHNIIPYRVKDNAWRDIIRSLMDTVEEVPAPEDAGLKGQFMFLVEKFCTARSKADSMEEILMDKVFSDKGRTYFQSSALLAFLDQHRFKITAKGAWAMLREDGAEDAVFAIGGKKCKAWSIPEITDANITFDTAKGIADGDVGF